MEFGNVDCFSCRKLFEEEERKVPCEVKGICYYTNDSEGPPKLTGDSAIAWNIWNTKEVLGEAMLPIMLEKYSSSERDVLVEILKEIEVLAIKYELKQPKNCIGGL